MLEWLASDQTEAELLAEDQNSEERLLSCQTQWLVAQEFLKQLWERSPSPTKPLRPRKNPAKSVGFFAEKVLFRLGIDA